MRRSAAALALAALLGWDGGALADGAPRPADPDGVLVRVGGFRVTRAQFDRRHEAVLAGLGGDPEKERSARARLASEHVRDLLLAEHARKEIVGDEGFLEDMRRNVVNEFLANLWLAPRLAGTEGDDARREKALSLVAKLERKGKAAYRFPLIGRDGKAPPDDRVFAEAAKEKFRFRRVRALLSADYRRLAAWPATENEATLRNGAEAVVRLELVARAARAEGEAAAGDPEGAEWLFRDRLKELALARCREEAFRPDPGIEAKVQENLPLAGDALHPMRVIVFKADDPKDVADFQKSLLGQPTENASAGSRITEVKFRRAAEYWLPRGFLPLPVELAALAVPPGRQFSEIVQFSGEHYVVRILERGEPPRFDLEAERKRLVETYSMQKYRAIVQETIEKARADTEVEVNPDLL